MNKRNYHTRYIFITLTFLTVLETGIYSQGTDSRRSSVNNDKVYIGILINPLKTNIVNEKLSSTNPLSFERRSGLNIALDFGYFFSKMVGISIAPGYCSYSAKLLLDSCSIKYQATDSENENYEMRIKGKSIFENQEISFLSIPVCVIFRYPAGEKFGFYVKGGLSFDIPITKTYKGAGTFSYDGYYPAYPVLLQNAPNYGFPSNLNTISSGSLKINSFNTELLASGGAYYSLSATLQLVLGVQFNKSMANISAYKPDPDFRLSSKANELNSIMAGSSTAGVQAFGLSIGIKYFLR